MAQSMTAETSPNRFPWKRETQVRKKNEVEWSRLTTETVEGTALALEGVDDVERSDGLALGVLGVGDGVTNNALEEGLENSTGLLVDHFTITVSIWTEYKWWW